MNMNEAKEIAAAIVKAVNAVAPLGRDTANEAKREKLAEAIVWACGEYTVEQAVALLAGTIASK